MGIKNGVQLKSKLQNTGTWLATAQPAYRQCYHPAVFFCHFYLMLSFLQGKMWRVLKNVVTSIFFLF
jgi:hypothetical protein